MYRPIAVTTMANAIIATNRMSLRSLIISENSPLQFIKNPNTGKVFFSCGSKTGYVSPNAEKKRTEGGKIDDFQYCEVTSINGEVLKDDAGNPRPMPCLMIVGNSQQNVVSTLGAELLH